MAPRGSDADVLMRIRATDEGGLRLLAAYQRHLRQLKKDAQQLAKTGQLPGLTREATERVRAADQYRRTIEKAYEMEARFNQRRAQQQRRLEQERLRGIERINRAEIAAHGENLRREKQRENAIRRRAQLEVTAAAEDARRTNRQIAAVRRRAQLETQAHAEDANRTRRREALIAAAAMREMRWRQRINQLHAQGILVNARLERQREAAQAAAAQRQIQRLRRMNQLHAQALVMNARIDRQRIAGTAAQFRQLSAMDAEASRWRQLRNALLAYYIARSALRPLTRFLSEGIRFQQTLETATLGVATIITATSELRDAQNQNIPPVEALTAAYGLAEKQLKQLRIAGLETAATTTELVEAFQQAVGPGLAAGLDLDEIRRITIQIVQAAGNIGLPMNQLNQEVRSILDATIDRNSRIAKILGLTNQEVKLAREQGRLYAMLNDRLQAFTVGGERAAGTFAVILSNVREAFEVFAGLGSQPLFEKLRARLGSLFEDAFDLDEATVSKQFEGLIVGIQRITGAIGDVLVDIITKMLSGAERLSVWLEQNRVQVGQIVDAFVEIIRAIGRIIAASGAFLGRLIAIDTEGQGVAASMRTIAGVLDTIRENGRLILAVFIGIKVAMFAAAVQAILLDKELLKVATGMKRLTALMITNPWVAAFVAATIAVGLLTFGLNQAIEKQRELIRLSGEKLRQDTEGATKQAVLIRQFEEASRALEAAKKGTDAYNRAQKDQNDAKEKLIELNPELRSALIAEGANWRDVTSFLKQNTESLLENLEARAAMLELDRDIQRQRVASLERQKTSFPGVTLITWNKAIAELEELEDTATTARDAVTNLRKELQKPADEVVTIIPRARDGEEKQNLAKAKNDARQIAQARLSEAREAFQTEMLLLEHALETEEIERNEFEARRNRALDQRVQRELDAIEIVREFAKADEGEFALFIAERNKIVQDGEQDRLRFTLQSIQTERRERKAAIAEAKRDVQDQIKEARTLLADLSTQLGERVARGEITKQQASVAFRRELSAQIALARELAEALEQNPLLQGTPELDQALQAINQHISRMQAQVLTAARLMESLGRTARESLTENLASALTDLTTGAENFGDAMANAARGIIRDIAQIISKMLVLELVQRTLGAFGIGGEDDIASAGAQAGVALAAGGAAASAAMIAGAIQAASILSLANPIGLGFAGGGYVSGPGTSTSDSIPAYLSRDEYVLNAAAVRRVGREALDDINFGASRPSIRSRGFYAAGGLVSSAAGIGGIGGIGELRVGLDPSLILQVMRSPEGARIFVEQSARNRNKLRRVTRK